MVAMDVLAKQDVSVTWC